MSDPKEYLTQEKFDELVKELDFLRNTKRKEVAEELEYAKQLGDLSENAEYHQAREEQAVLEDRISKLDGLLKAALIINNKANAKRGDTVVAGSVIELRHEGKKEVVTYTIVGSEEADMKAKKISSSSPLAAALLGKKKGDAVTIKTPSGSVEYSVIKVS
jgi:transcription elongation factor GreA